MVRVDVLPSQEMTGSWLYKGSDYKMVDTGMLLVVPIMFVNCVRLASAFRHQFSLVWLVTD